METFFLVKINKNNISDFCNSCDSFDTDIDLIDGSNVLDAKDYEHVILISFNKNLCVSINSNDEQEILRFNRIMDKYKV